MLTGSLAGSQPGDAIETFTILSAAANETVARAHGRMPGIVPRETCGPWLAGEEVPLAPCPVRARVNRPANDDARCIEPVSPG